MAVDVALVILEMENLPGRNCSNDGSKTGGSDSKVGLVLLMNVMTTKFL